MPKPFACPKMVDVEVRLLGDSDKQDLEGELSSSIGTGQVLTFDNKEKGAFHDGFIVNFNVTDDTGTGYTFPANAHDAMWAKPVDHFGESCPDEQHWSQFQAIEVCNDGNTLRVRNLNRKKKKFKFALRFTWPGQHGQELAMYDPGGDNNNGSARD